jgi:tetratricopeptide (TPR) repeat protein
VSQLRSILVAFAAGLLVAGCAAMFVPETDDPAEKLKWAELLYHEQERPLPAEKLIWEALEIYRDRGDRLGVAEAYRQYAFFLRAPNVGRYADLYRDKGFMDPSVTLDNRLEKSLEYLETALAIYETEGAYRSLVNIHFAIAINHHVLGREREACSALDDSLASYREAVERDPEGAVILPNGYVGWEEVIRDGKKDVGGCP